MVSETKSEEWALTVLGLTAVLALGAFAYEGGLDTLLGPLGRVDLAAVYLRYHFFIDAIVFFSLFLGLVHTTIRSQLPGRGGAAASVALAAALSVGLLVAERAARFSLADFGPVAAAILICAFAVVVYRLVRALGLDAAGSGGLAFVIAYLGARAAAPNLFSYALMNPWLAGLNLGAVIAFLVFASRAAAGLFHGKDVILGRAVGALGKALRPLREGVFSEEETKQLEEEREAVSAYLARIVDRPFKENVEILSDLAVVGKALEKYGESPEARRLIAEKIQIISSCERTIMERLKAVKSLNERLRAFDLRLLTRLRAAYEKMTEGERKRVRALFARQVQKLALEDKIGPLERAFAAYDSAFLDALEHLVAGLRLGQIERAKAWLDRATAQEGEAAELMEEIGRVEQDIRTLARVPLSELQPRSRAREPALVSG